MSVGDITRLHQRVHAVPLKVVKYSVKGASVWITVNCANPGIYSKMKFVIKMHNSILMIFNVFVWFVEYFVLSPCMKFPVFVCFISYFLLFRYWYLTWKLTWYRYHRMVALICFVWPPPLLWNWTNIEIMTHLCNDELPRTHCPWMRTYLSWQ